MSRKRRKKARSCVVEGRPEIGGEIGDREQRHAARVERLDDLVDAGHGPVIVSPKRSLQAADQRGIIGEFLGELGRGLGIGPAAVERLVPAVEVDILDEAQARLIVGDLADEEGFGIPAVEDVADVEDDGGASVMLNACRPRTVHCWTRGLSPGAP